MNLLQMAKQMQNMQSEMKKVRALLAGRTVTGQGGRGSVSITLNGIYQVREVKIDPGLLDQPDAAHLEKLVAEALREVLDKTQKLAASQVSHLTGNLPGPNPLG